MATVSDKTLASALAYDPLAMAEEITGQPFGADGKTEAIGLCLHINHAQRKRMLLEATDDTPFNCDLPAYLRIAADEGFETVLELPFHSDSSEQDETLYVLFHREHGILLVFDTWHGKVNGGKFYYNWKPADGQINWRRCLSSGRRTEVGIWAGDHDCREALRFHIRQLKEQGAFVTPWIERPFLWLLHHADTKGEYDHKAINGDRIAMLPEHVRNAITPEMEAAIKEASQQ